MSAKPNREAAKARAITQQEPTAESQIRALIESWALAVRRHDLPGILAHHSDDVVMFDVPPPLQSRGLDAYRKTWDLFFSYHQPLQAFDIEELAITASDEVGFAVAIMRCGSDGLLFRLTIGLRNLDGRWSITHEHHSVPAADQS
jgi:ketosteroid isomerase-like protein